MQNIMNGIGARAVLREGEGNAGGAGGDQQGQWKAPDGMPTDLVGKDAAETLAKVWTSHGQLNTRAEGLRTQLAQLPKAPDKPELYTFTPSDKAAPFIGDAANNPVLALARTAAHKHGMSQAAFEGFINEIYGAAVDGGVLAAPFDPKVEVQSYMKAMGVDAVTTGAQFKEAEAYAKGLAAQLQLPAGVSPELKAEVEASLVALTDTAAGNILLRALQSRLGQSGFKLPAEGQGGAPGALTADDLRKMSSDPRIDPANRHLTDPARKFDPDLRKRYDDGYAALHGKK